MKSTADNFTLFNMGDLSLLSEKEENGKKGRLILGDKLGLSGCEISVNNLSPSEFFPFVHTHKLNEEVYIILSGIGLFHVDGEEFTIREGSRPSKS